MAPKNDAKPSVEVALASIITEITLDAREILATERRGFIAVLAQMVASMANAKGKPEEAVKLLNDAMDNYQKWDERAEELAVELSERSRSAIKLLADVAGLSEQELEVLEARLGEPDDGCPGPNNSATDPFRSIFRRADKRERWRIGVRRRAAVDTFGAPRCQARRGRGRHQANPSGFGAKNYRDPCRDSADA